ncbi:MAG: hypothetical protein ABJB86_16900 [Bacteroidota bacterium]
MVHTPANQLIHGKFKYTSQRKRNKKTQTAKRTGITGSNDFLKARFYPVRDNRHKALNKSKTVASEFYTSLASLAALYQFPLPEKSPEPYPLNIAMDYRKAKQILTGINGELELMIVQDKTRHACLTTVKSFSIGSTLSYIPVRLLSDLLKDKKNKQTSNLLLSIFSWFYHKVEIPFFTKRSSFLNSCYETIKEWYTEQEDGDEEEIAETIKQFDIMETEGNNIYKLIQMPMNLKEFALRIKTYKPTNEIQTEFLQIANTIYNLSTTHPNPSIHKNVYENLLEPETEDRIRVDNYVSFYWDSQDDICDHLIEYVNSYLQEYSIADEPLSFQYFDIPQSIVSHDLQFEENLFTAIDDLSYILNKGL